MRCTRCLKASFLEIFLDREGESGHFKPTPSDRGTIVRVGHKTLGDSRYQTTLRRLQRHFWGVPAENDLFGKLRRVGAS